MPADKGVINQPTVILVTTLALTVRNPPTIPTPTTAPTIA